MSEAPVLQPLSVWWEAIQGHLEVYLLNGRSRGIIDTGAPGALLGDALQSLGRSVDDVALVLNTHAHADHTGGNAAFKTKGVTEFLIHREDAPYAEDPGKSFDYFFAPLVRLLRGEEAAAAERADYVAALGGGFMADRLLEDGDVIDLGGSLQLVVVHVPGHTPGSCGFYWGTEGILVLGDAVAGLGTPEGSLPLVYDMAAYQRSIDRVLGLPIKTLRTTHPYRAQGLAPATVREGAEVRAYLESSRDLAARLEEAFAAEAETALERAPADVADAVIRRLPAKTGHSTLAGLPFPDFTLTTVMCGTGLWPARS